MRTTVRCIGALSLAALTVASATGCASLGKKEQGAIIGAGAGAVIGGAIGKYNGSTAKGAIIGAVVGGAAGAIIGHQMDQQAKELKQNIPGAVVERVGEGIQVTFQSGLLYDFDSDVVKGSAQSNLTTLAKSLDQYPKSNLLIVGHTDSVGTHAYNEDLSRRRAQAAANYLVSQGLERARVQTMGLGETEPVNMANTDAAAAQNRRVEVAIYASPEMVADAKRKAGAN
jgi:outer membrane protein OmpA-like peptidoglycan-associated protein